LVLHLQQPLLEPKAETSAGGPRSPQFRLQMDRCSTIRSGESAHANIAVIELRAQRALTVGGGAMGLRLSKSIRLGAVRFNLSSSGIGVSAGIPGLRVGTGPRGAYISGSVGAFRYRKSLRHRRADGSNAAIAPVSAPDHRQSAPSNAPGQGLPQAHPGTIGRTTYDTASVLELSDASSEAVLETIREQRARAVFWPFSAVASVLALFALVVAAPQLPPPVFALATAAVVGGTLWMRWRDQLRRLTVLFYELDAESAGRFEALSQAVHSGAQAFEFTAVTERVTYADRKYHSGADHGVSSKPARASHGFPEGIVANVAFPMLHAEKTTLVFLPDLVLLIQGGDIGAVEYRSLRIECRPVTIIQSTPNSPNDSTVIGHNWRYPNKDGGQDRRFKDNYQLPKCRYSELALTTGSGLNVRFMSSRDQGLESLSAAVSRMAGDAAARRSAAEGMGTRPQEGASISDGTSVAVPSRLMPTIAVGVLAFGVLFGLTQGIASSKLSGQDAGAASNASTANVSDDDLAQLKTKADAQPSFDCGKAKSFSERLICGNPELAALDRGLAQHFDFVRGSLAEADRKAFATEARKAWQAREAHCRDAACLTEWYRTRNSQLDAWDARVAAAAANRLSEQASGADQAAPISAAPGSQAAPVAAADASRIEIFQQTTSFCPSPQSDAQRIICSDLDLGGRQLALNRRFDDDRVRFEAKLPADRYSAFVTESETAARYRDEQCHDKDCILGWYRGRVEQLAAWEAATP